MIFTIKKKINYPGRTVPFVQKTVITVLVSINIELINFMVTYISSLLLFAVAVSNLNFVIAQIFVCSGITVGCVICELFAAISISKLLLVTKFPYIFSRDPDHLGIVIMSTAVILAILPGAVACIYETLEGRLLIRPVAYLIGVNYLHQGTSYLFKILMFWVLLALCTLVITIFYIPHHLKQQGISQAAIQAGESNALKKEVNLKRIFVGVFGLLLHLTLTILDSNTGLYKDIPINFYTSTTGLNLVLVFFLLNDNVWKFIKKETQKKFPFLVILCKVNDVTPDPHHLRV
jgi:hypothetical protein